MYADITEELQIPEGISIPEDTHIKVMFELDRSSAAASPGPQFGLAIILATNGTDGETDRVNFKNTIADLPVLDELAMQKFQSLQQSCPSMFEAVLGAAADWYARHFEFSLRREAVGTEDDHIVFEMREKDKPGGEVFATEPFLREWAVEYLVIP